MFSKFHPLLLQRRVLRVREVNYVLIIYSLYTFILLTVLEVRSLKWVCRTVFLLEGLGKNLFTFSSF